MKPLTLVVDKLACNTLVAQHLRTKEIRIVESSLKVGQYRITDTCVIWHLTAAEFAKMAADKTVYRRIIDFKRWAAEPLVILEGDPAAQPSGASVGALRGAMAFVAMHNRVPILAAADSREVAELIYIMANQAQNGMGLTITETPAEEAAQPEATPVKAAEGNGSLPKDPEERQEYIVRAVPDIPAAAARAMLKKYGSLRAIFAASAKELTEFEGIGPKKAKKIVSFLSGNLD